MRIAGWLAAAGVAAASCLTVLHVLREPPQPPPARGPEVASPRGVAASRAAEPAADVLAAPSAADARQRVDEAAGRSQAQEQALRDAIFGIGEDEDLPLAARLERYRAALQSARAEAPHAPMFAYPSMLAEAFLRMEGVQRELAALAPAARREEIAHIRRELGFSEDQIARMQELDDWREARWQNGLLYMEERARLGATFEGDVLEQELHHLRERYFAHEAPTIEREEQSGFYRFERPRIYGRN